MGDPSQEVEVRPFIQADLPASLDLPWPQFATDDRHLGQLRNILANVASLGCASVAIENHYIDRDYMEDHSVFYSRNLHTFANHCRRLHFFSIPDTELARELKELRDAGRLHGRERFLGACEEFSRRAYLGFMVVRPLPGSPVGRTVVRPPAQEQQADALNMKFRCTRQVPVHFCGITLTVDGLAFQQQDMGVSACATTALWSSFGMMRHLEEFGASTPAQITMMAAKYSLPFGRAFPSEGLSIDQMCQAVQAVSLAPNLFRCTSPELTLGYLYACTKSGVAPVVVLQFCKNPLLYHAVCVAGMGLIRAPAASPDVFDRAISLARLYVHDDRHGPYLPGDLEARGDELVVKLSPLGLPPEEWRAKHILIPMPPKVRLSYGGLREIAWLIAGDAHLFVTEVVIPEGTTVAASPVQFENWVSRAHSYLESLLWVWGSDRGQKRAEDIGRTVALSRYLGIIRVCSAAFGVVDVLIDTTSTRRNPRCLAVVVRKDNPIGSRLAEFLAGEYSCPAFV